MWFKTVREVVSDLREYPGELNEHNEITRWPMNDIYITPFSLL